MYVTYQDLVHSPRGIVLYNLPGKEIAATTANSDGLI